MQVMEQRYNKNKTAGWKKIILASVMVVALTLLVSGAVGGVWMYGIVQSAPNIEEDSFDYSNSTRVFDENGEEIVTLNGGEDRQSISIDEVPTHVQEAFIAIEDVRFYEHSGLDMRRIGGALVSNIRDGFGAEGGSTITQQVVKNSLLTSEKSIERKVQEGYLALELEREYSKDEILELYLNKIYFGNGAYGIANAADQYFGKELEELTTVEAALLAGLPQRPTGYDPYQHEDLAQERRDTVLYVMREHGFISQEEYEEAVNITVGETLEENGNEYNISDAFMDQVYRELEEVDEVDEAMIFNNGIEIYTTYDQEAQAHMEEVLNTDDFVDFPDDEFQAGVTLIDNQTGEIKAIGGGRNQEAGVNRSNYATNIQRDPGSTIKPILSYGPAIEHLEWSTYQQINDEEMFYTDDEDGDPITNHNNEYHGEVSMREALKRSWNVPAVKTFQEVGNDRAGEFAAGVGMPMEESIFESAALGSLPQGISPLELGGAYSAFANEGVYNDPHVIKRIVLPNGEEMELQPESTEVMSDYTSYMVTDMLKDVVEDGTGTLAAIDGVPVAGKTGTTNFDGDTAERFDITEGVPDVWFAGYTTEYTVSVWTGYSQVTEENYITPGDDMQIARHIFREVMEEMSSEDTPDFEKPDSVEEITIDTANGTAATASTPEQNRATELFVSGTDIADAFNVIEGEYPDDEENNNNDNNENNNNNDNDENNENNLNDNENNNNNENDSNEENNSNEQNALNEETDENNEENTEDNNGANDVEENNGSSNNNAVNEGINNENNNSNNNVEESVENNGGNNNTGGNAENNGGEAPENDGGSNNAGGNAENNGGNNGGGAPENNGGSNNAGGNAENNGGNNNGGGAPENNGGSNNAGGNAENNGGNNGGGAPENNGGSNNAGGNAENNGGNNNGGGTPENNGGSNNAGGNAENNGGNNNGGGASENNEGNNNGGAAPENNGANNNAGGNAENNNAGAAAENNSGNNNSGNNNAGSSAENNNGEGNESNNVENNNGANNGGSNAEGNGGNNAGNNNAGNNGGNNNAGGNAENNGNNNNAGENEANNNANNSGNNAGNNNAGNNSGNNNADVNAANNESNNNTGENEANNAGNNNVANNDGNNIEENSGNNAGNNNAGNNGGNNNTGANAENNNAGNNSENNDGNDNAGNNGENNDAENNENGNNEEN